MRVVAACGLDEDLQGLWVNVRQSGRGPGDLLPNRGSVVVAAAVGNRFGRFLELAVRRLAAAALLAVVWQPAINAAQNPLVGQPGVLSAVATPAKPVPALVTPQQLRQALAGESAGADNPLVLDLREPHGDDTLFHYSAGHIPGAVNLPYSAWRATGRQPGRLPKLNVLAGQLAGLGVHPARWVVLVHDGSEPSEMGTAARAYWTLKSLGFSRLSILNGGYAEWLDADLPSTTQATARPASPTVFDVRWQETWRATQQDVLASKGGAQPNKLLDARPKAFFDGVDKHPLARQAGTIAGASHVAFDVWLDEDGRVLPADTLRERAGKLGLLTSTAQAQGAAIGTVTTFCNAGHWAAISWFVLSEVLQVPQTRLYAESMVGWAHAGLPMDHAPSRSQQLVEQWRQLWAQIADVLTALWQGEGRAQGAGHAG